tara:strand:- start:366 stop:575 length:210 start_codon:yes stop_codon:yes gene_type:complete
MDADELRELADKLEELNDLKDKLEEAMCLADEIESLCGDLDIMPSHHASMELGSCHCEVESAIQTIEDL